MSIKLGTTDPADFKLGTTDVAKLCIGTTEVYSATTTPSAPQSLSASAGDTQVALSWSAPASDGGATVTGYKVYQSTDDASFSEVATPSGTSQTITGLTNGTTYYFKVAAVNSVGTGTQTSSVSASPSASATAPSVPQSLSATRGNTQVALSWSAPSSDGGATITGYKVYQSTDDASFSEVATPSGTSHTITGLTNGTTYYFKVAAVNSVGTGTQTSSVNAVPATTPGVPQSLSGTRGNTQVALSWSAPSSNGGTAVTGYKVYQSTDDASFSEVATPSGTSHTVTGLTNGTTYYFKVAAVNAVGTGTQTSSVSAVPATNPGVPQSLSATHGNAQVALSWSAPASNGGTAVTGYKVYQSTDDASFSEVATPSGTSHTVTSLTNGTQYYFKVAAVNAVGTGSQTSSVNATPATTPAAPTSLAATNGDTQSVLTWTAPTNTGGSAITGYKVKWGATSGFPGNAAYISTGSTSATYTKTSLTNGTQYSFQVAAINAEGDGTYSSTATATPAAASSGITPNTDSSARFYLPASQTTFRVSANTSSGYFKISSPGKTDVIGNDHATMYPTYYLQGGSTYAEMSGLSSSATKTVTVSPCDASGNVSGNIIGIDVGTDATNNVDAVDISGLTSLTTCNLGASGATLSGSKGMGSPIGSRSMASSITEIRAVNVDFSTGGGAYYSPTWTPQVYVYGGGLDLYNQDLDATALNQLYTDLSSGTGGGDIYVGQNPGTGSDNTSLASNYTIYGS